MDAKGTILPSLFPNFINDFNEAGGAKPQICADDTKQIADMLEDRNNIQNNLGKFEN